MADKIVTFPSASHLSLKDFFPELPQIEVLPFSFASADDESNFYCRAMAREYLNGSSITEIAEQGPSIDAATIKAAVLEGLRLEMENLQTFLLKLDAAEC